MKIESRAAYAPPLPAPTGATMGAASDAAVPAFDPTSATRQDMRDWVNGQVRSGAMSLRDSTALVSLSVSLPGAADDQQADFVDLARQAQGGAAYRGDANDVARMGWALDRLEGLDVRA
ncbi:hypothetical protein [Caulobacter soli]|uniref:hypothetical protein n=1 Tax=Caulobacter soli TaxID=2708539 RepID=UPI0013EB058F|nr:hypothetical protein [Caulobacter soli]